MNTLVDLYSHHQQRIYRYCLALLRNPDDAEDATQETFTRAAPFLPNLPGDLSAYLTTVARNICCDVVRARSRRSVPIDNVPLTDRRVSPERQSVDWDVVRRMWRQLSPSERLLFAYTFAGYKYEEIASRTGMSRPSVSVGLARARRRLRDLAAATGTLGLLPLGIRRLLSRLGRRAGAAVQSSQAVLLQAADQAGALVAGLLAGSFALSASVGSMPGMVATAAHRSDLMPNPGGGGPAAAVATGALSSPGHGVPSQLNPATRHRLAAPATPPAALAPAVSNLPGAQATPATTAVDYLTASPNYPADHTVFLSGEALVDNCWATAPGPCSALFRSEDSGATWTPLTQVDSTVGSILLAPTFPTDPAFFIVSQTGLAESSTGDGSLDWNVPGVTAAAIAPWSAPGHARLAALVRNAVAFYDSGSSTPQPGPTLPAGFVPTALAYGGPGNLVVSGYVPSASSQYASAVTDCPLTGACSAATVLPDGDLGTGPILEASPQVATDRVVALSTIHDVFVSTDGGASFKQDYGVSSSQDIKTLTVGQGAAGPRIVASYVSGSYSRARVVESDDVGATFQDVTGDLDAITNLISLAAYPDGTILAGINASTTVNHFALREMTRQGVWINPS